MGPPVVEASHALSGDSVEISERKKASSPSALSAGSWAGPRVGEVIMKKGRTRGWRLTALRAAAQPRRSAKRIK